MTTVLIAGGTGTIGKRLQGLLIQKGYDVIILSRSTPKGKVAARTRYARWHVERGEIDKEAISESDHIINLAGAPVIEQRWTSDRKNDILESRVQTAALLVNALHTIPNKVKTVVSASASGYYGEDNLLSLNDGFTEDDEASGDFLGDVCRQWEESIEAVTALGKRLVILRTGIVLSRKGGAYAEFIKPLRLKIAAILGNGRQVVSWIHEDDICNMYLYALEQEHMSGPYNAVAPQPVTNKELIVSIARSRSRFYLPLHVPAFVIKAVMGEMAVEVLKSANLSAAKIAAEGYTFLYPEIGAAAAELARS